MLIGLVIVALLVVVLVWILPSFTGQMDDTAVEITSGNASSAEGESVPGESDSMDVPAQNEPQDDGSSDNPG